MKETASLVFLFLCSIHSSCRRQAQQELEENSQEDSGKRCPRTVGCSRCQAWRCHKGANSICHSSVCLMLLKSYSQVPEILQLAMDYTASAVFAVQKVSNPYDQMYSAYILGSCHLEYTSKWCVKSALRCSDSLDCSLKYCLETQQIKKWISLMIPPRKRAEGETNWKTRQADMLIPH